MSDQDHQAEEFDKIRISGGRLFGDSVEEDPWTVFHGTSESCGADIEIRGFQYDDDRLNVSDVQQVLDVFDSMRWIGAHQGGYAVLKTFSMSDFAGSLSSPVFFAEWSARALLYAAVEHAGGEKLRAVRLAIADLRAYLADESVRVEHAMCLEVDFNYLVRHNAAIEEIERCRPPAVDFDWLDSQVKALDDLDRTANRPVEEFSGGVVYAVRLEPSDLAGLEYDSAMGIKARNPVPPARIVGKLHVPVGYVHNMSAFGTDVGLRNRRREAGVVAAIAQRASLRSRTDELPHR